MKQSLTLFLFALSFYAQGQTGLLFGTDSLKNVRWEIDVLMYCADRNGNDSSFCDYDSSSFSLNKTNRITVLVCGQTTQIGSTTYVPRALQHKIGTPKYYESKTGHAPPDSIWVPDGKRIDQFFIDKKDSLTIDTLVVKDAAVYDYNHDAFLINKCSFKNGKKDGDEYGYYTIQELKGVCIEDHFMLKYQGHWTNGKKDGKWKEFDKTGKLISVKKYKRGKLIRQTDY